MIKKDAYWFSHDSNAKDDPKCMLLIDQMGLEGYGIYWVLVETLREQPNYSYPLKLVPILARRYNTSAEKMMTVINGYGLFEIENNEIFFSNSLKQRMLILENKRAKLKQAAEIRWKKQKELPPKLDANAMHMHSKCSANEILSKVKESKVKESKVKESKEKDNRDNHYQLAQNFNAYFDHMTSQSVMERLSMNLMLPKNNAHLVVKEFLETCYADISGKQNKLQVEQYFINWVRAKEGRVDAAINNQIMKLKHEADTSSSN